jgi:NAD-dependent dihydropyrimidine dehydrogenase PreA subunit/flavodoxin
MIFYFTATGNSRYIAERIAASTGDRIRDMSDCVQNDGYLFELGADETLGFVVPVYYYGVPMIVSEFLEKIKIQAGQDFYSYAVLNCGGTTGDAGRFVRDAFKVDAMFGIKVVDNYVPMLKTIGEAEIVERLDKAEQEIHRIVSRINSREAGVFNTAAGVFPRLLTSLAYPLYKNGRKTGKFKASEKCTGCGLCEKVCPRKVIDCTEKKPVWTKRQCEICLACLHRCPALAIEYGKSAGKGRYLNPRVEWEHE